MILIIALVKNRQQFARNTTDVAAMKQLLCLAEHHKVTALLRIAPPMCLALRSSAIPTDVLRDAIHITTADGRIAVTLWN